MSGIVVVCPKCEGRVNIGFNSRFHVFDCPHCSRQFRGIHANQVGSDLARTFKDGFHNMMHVYTLFLWPSASQQRGGNTEVESMYTPCPHCTMKIGMGAEVCPYCTRDLPRSVV